MERVNQKKEHMENPYRYLLYCNPIKSIIGSYNTWGMNEEWETLRVNGLNRDKVDRMGEGVSR